MSIPELTFEERSRFTGHVFSKKEFNDTYIKALEVFYQKDDEGKKKKNIIKKGINFLKAHLQSDDSKYGYDVMYKKVLKLSKSLSDSSLRSFINGLKQIKKILESYITNKNKEKNKTKYVEELNFLLMLTIQQLDDWLTKMKSLKTLSNRELAGYFLALNPHTNSKEIKRLVTQIAVEMAERSKDPRQKADIDRQMRETTVY